MKKFYIIFFWGLVCSVASAQSDVPIYRENTVASDVTARVGAEVKFDLSGRFGVTFKEDVRLKNDFSAFDKINSSIHLTNQITNYFKMGIGYTFMSILHDGRKRTDYKKYWDLRHRCEVDATFHYKVLRWKFILHERTLAVFRTQDYDKGEKVNPAFVLRSRLQTEYQLRNKPIKPYASFELSNTLNVPEYVGSNYINRYRFGVGMKYKFNQKNGIDLFYRFDIGTNYDVNIKRDRVEIQHERNYKNIIGVFYNFN